MAVAAERRADGTDETDFAPAIVESGAHLGVDVQIGPCAYVAGTVRLGDGCVLAPHAVV